MTDVKVEWLRGSVRPLHEDKSALAERRAMYAGAALTGLLSAATAGSVIDPEGIARNAFELADVMLKVEEQG